MTRLSFLLAALLFLTGCTSFFYYKSADLSHLKRFYVEQRLADNHRLDEQIVAELKAHGLDATGGVLTMKPDGIDVIVSYDDRWEWDFKTYLIDLRIDLRDGRTDKPLATGQYHQAKLTTKSSEEVIRMILKPILKAN